MKKHFKWFALSLVSLCWIVSAPAAKADFSAPTQVSGMESQKPNVFEGWIVKIEYNKNMFRLLDPRGFEKKIKTKPGIIGDYRMGDHVRVEVDPAIKTAYSIEKLI